MNVFLGDLVHTSPLGISIDAFPLNIGFLAAYAQRRFPGQFEFRLFKHPEAILEALQTERPDLLGLSNYPWNKRVSEMVFRRCKQAYPDVVTIFGGPNFPNDLESEERFLRPMEAIVDFYVVLEGEQGFCNVLEAFLGRGPDVKRMKAVPIESCAYYPEAGAALFKGPQALRFNNNLDTVPSPYLTGILDPFFNRKMVPMIQTTRGCPFSCAFCHEGETYYSKVGFFPVERVREEVAYIAERTRDSKILMITDSNFGMYPRDIEIASHIQQIAQTHAYPATIWATTGKNNKERIFHVVNMLSDKMRFSMTVQSMDKEVLQHVRRQNIPPEQYVELQQRIVAEDMWSYAEMILGLPGDTKEKHLSGFRYLMSQWVGDVVSFNFMLLESTYLNTPQARAEFKMRGKFRLLPRAFGEYLGEKCFDVEEIVVETATMSFEDMIEIRVFTLIQNLLYNTALFHEFLRFAWQEGVEPIDVIRYIQQEHAKFAPLAVREQIRSFDQKARQEFFESEEDLKELFSKQDNYDKLSRGELAGNLIQLFSIEGIVFHFDAWVETVRQAVTRMLTDRGGFGPAHQGLVEAIQQHILARTVNLLQYTGQESQARLAYDVPQWVSEKFSKPLASYRTEGTSYRYRLSEEPKAVLETFLSQYGTNAHELGRLLKRIQPRFLRKEPMRAAGELLEAYRKEIPLVPY